MSAAVISHIVEQHAEEAAFLWILRSYAALAPHYRLKDLTNLVRRINVGWICLGNPPTIGAMVLRSVAKLLNGVEWRFAGAKPPYDSPLIYGRELSCRIIGVITYRAVVIFLRSIYWNAKGIC
jgi:hypothetical protein